MTQEVVQARIAALELELEMSQKKADQMHDVLDSTKTHYDQLEKKYDQANQLLRNYQERLVLALQNTSPAMTSGPQELNN